jgi:hypothetical protein
MNKPYNFILKIIVLIFLFIESSELRTISYSQDTGHFSNLNNTVLLGKSLNLDNKNYVANEFADIKKIEEVSLKLITKTEDPEEFKIITRTPSGQYSIYVQALQSFSIASRRKISTSYPGFIFNIQDRVTGNLIRPSTILEAHVACGNAVSKLPRVIEKQDKKIKFGPDFFDMFCSQYEKIFGYNLIIEENVSKDDNRNRVKRAKKRLFKTYGDTSESFLRVTIFENPCVIKASGCRYRDRSEYVTIYYDALSDIFAIVNSQSNKLLEFSVATEVDYADVFRYKSVFQNQTASE